MDKLYTRTVTVVIRDDTTLIHCGDSPRYRTVKIDLTDEQVSLLRLRENEEVSRMIMEPNGRMLADPVRTAAAGDDGTVSSNEGNDIF